MNRRAVMIFLAVYVIMLVMQGQALAEGDSGQDSAGNGDMITRVIESQGNKALEGEVNTIGDSIVGMVRTFFVTICVLALILSGLQAAGGGLKDPRKVELLKRGGISAAVSAVLVYKAEIIVGYVLNLLGVQLQ